MDAQLKPNVPRSSKTKLRASSVRDASNLREAVSAYPEDTSAALLAMIARYKAEGRPVDVSFRQTVPWLKVGERATHYLHPYPAKLLPQIAHFFIAANILSRSEGSVLDPFAGSGTVALETTLSGKRALYAEVNPFAQLLTAAKTFSVCPDMLYRRYNALRVRVKKVTEYEKARIVNPDIWYDPETFHCLSRIRHAISAEKNHSIRNALNVAFSVVARKASRADPRFSVPVRRRNWIADEPLDGKQRDASVRVWALFDTQISATLRRYRDYQSLVCTRGSNPEFVGHDARALKLPTSGQGSAPFPAPPMPESFVDLIITSPPYASAQKYVRAASLSLGWLGLSPPHKLSELEQQTIGREHIRKADQTEELFTAVVASAHDFIAAVSKLNPKRAAITAIYLKEMSDAVSEMVRVLKPGGFAVIVIGDNRVCGLKFESSRYLTDMFTAAGCSLELHAIDKIPSRGLMTKRANAASVIAEEAILLFKKAAKE